MTSLEKLSFDFFREFSRCEYCLKAVGFLKVDRRYPAADWIAFAADINAVFDKPDSQSLMQAVNYYLTHPPKKQTTLDGNLVWIEETPTHTNKAELIVKLICRVRNNLFHGGKFNGHWFEPQRSEELLHHGLIILKACVIAHNRVHEAYEQKAM